jgi:outer membrane protein OmpA-like peptidoglycan-associated protein
MKLFQFVIGCSIVCIFLTSCASATKQKNLFVLIPDADGKVGSITVTNKNGSQTMSNPRQAVEVTGTHTAPTTPFLLQEGEITKVFGAALAVQKEYPVWQVFFELNTATLTKNSQETLKEIIATIKDKKSTDVSIIGHTDRVGTQKNNYALSIERAIQVRNILASQSIDPRFIEVNGYGEEIPLIKTEDEVAEPRNRRAEVRIR